MKIEYDPIKSEKNEKERGLPFSLVDDFIFRTAFVVQDLRHTQEKRYKATGYIDDKLFTIIFTFRDDKIRVISLRDASRAERRDYAIHFNQNR